jgi:hypothetical protein
MNIGVLYTRDWRPETGEAETIKSKANEIKKNRCFERKKESGRRCWC